MTALRDQIIGALREAPYSTASEVADVIGVRAATVGMAMRRMTDRGHLRVVGERQPPRCRPARVFDLKDELKQEAKPCP